MSEFIYLYRFPQTAPPTPEQRAQRMQRWTTWMNDLESKGHLRSQGKPLDLSGGVVRDKKGTFTDGPCAEAKDIVMGFSIVEAKDLKQAIELSVGCPILEGGGLVEVRPIHKM
jgi:hypothetical protein